MAHEILNNEQMSALDQKTIESGVPGFDLMTAAGKAVADEILKRDFAGRALILCGPGNNGGDGFVIADILQNAGWTVRVACLIDPASLKGDAKKAHDAWNGEALGFDVTPNQDELVIDAVFGTGLSKALESPVTDIFDAVRASGAKVIAVDTPSGVNGNTGSADPHTLHAKLTVTFHRKKLGHILHPGASFCGDIVVRDIGLLEDFDYTVLENHPDLWLEHLLKRQKDSHKYDYGHAVIYAAPELTGATRLAAAACARMGSGLTTVLCSPETAAIYRTSLPAHIMVRDSLKWDDDRVTARLYGSGGLPKNLKFKTDQATVLDADALTPDLPTLNENTILTPHYGEFARTFPKISGNRTEKAQTAAKQSGAIILLKGPETIIAHPDGRVAINTHASPNLATAGSGDVLAGMINGLLAQNMPPFEAACAATWIHGECALVFGAGLVASDLPEIIPEVLQDLT